MSDTDTDVHCCEEEGCQSFLTTEYHWLFAPPGEPKTIWLCGEHAVENGFCLWCRNFAAGSEDYDFSPLKGYHRDCYDELRAELGEDIVDGDEDDWDFYYPAPWFDPASPVSELEPPDTPTHRYIGPGSEFGPEDEENR